MQRQHTSWFALLGALAGIALYAQAPNLAHAQVAVGASVRFGGHPAYAPIARTGSVRYGHAATVYRAPVVRERFAPVVPVRAVYSDPYFRRFRPGYRPVVIGGRTHYYYPALPFGYRPVVVGPTTYYFAAGVYYQPYFYQGSTVYLAVPPPLP